MLVSLGDCLVVSFLGFLEHLLGLLNLYLAGRNIYAHQDGVSKTRSFLEILQRLGPFHNSLGKHLALLGQPLLLDDLKDCNNVCEVFPVVPTGVYMCMLRWDASGSLILKIWDSSLGMTMSTTGMYGMGGQ